MQLNSIIVSRTDSIGDVMLTLPLLGVIKKHYPQTKIIFLGSTYTQAIAKACKHIDVFINWSELQQQPVAEQKKVLSADAIIHVFPNKKIATLAKKAGIKIRIGTSHRLFHLFTCNKLVNFSRKNSDLHESQLNLKLLAPIGINEIIYLAEMPNYYGFQAIEKLPERFAKLIDKNKMNIILHPKSKGSAREWGLANFSKLIALLPKEQYNIFITGTAEEGRLMAEFLKQENNATDITGQLTLPEFISFINACDALVAASTGPLHVAAALGKKAIGIFAPMKPIHPGRWMPIGKQASYLVLDKNCLDCKKKNTCACIQSITAQQVFNQLIK